MARQLILGSHHRGGVLKSMNLAICFLIVAAGCVPLATITYAPSGLSSGTPDPGGTAILVLGFQDLTENGQQDPYLLAKNIRATETITEIVTSAVSSELQSRGFSVDTFGSQAGVWMEALVDALTKYEAQATHPVGGVVWGKITQFFYRGLSSKATVEIEFIAMSTDTREILYSTKQSCSRSDLGRQVAMGVIMSLTMVPTIPFLFRAGKIARDGVASMLSTCLEETVRKGVGSEEMVKTLRGAYSPSK